MFSRIGPVLGLLSLFVVRCSGPAPNTEHRTTNNVPARDTTHWHGPSALERVNFPQVADNVRHDTLVIQTTFDMGDGTFLMVASSVPETFEGLRLFHYELLPDSNAGIIARSAPAYDSWTMLPTFFAKPGDSTSMIVLANFGEKQSWGQKVMRLDRRPPTTDKSGFTDLGFLEVALHVRIVESDSSYLRRENIAPFVRCTNGDPATFEFARDSVYLYDDGRAGRDYIIAADRVKYQQQGDGLVMWIDGEPPPADSTVVL